mmetsp:Transcript_122022/g.171745  ORF Transcript_122022/g.171745 Transcript_122022/m.171745 type:complete len:220 (+) Transcript_122022:37-696(+)
MESLEEGSQECKDSSGAHHDGRGVRAGGGAVNVHVLSLLEVLKSRTLRARDIGRKGVGGEKVLAVVINAFLGGAVEPEEADKRVIPSEEVERASVVLGGSVANAIGHAAFLSNVALLIELGAASTLATGCELVVVLTEVYLGAMGAPLAVGIEVLVGRLEAAASAVRGPRARQTGAVPGMNTAIVIVVAAEASSEAHAVVGHGELEVSRGALAVAALVE